MTLATFVVKTFHKDVSGFPADMPQPVPGMSLFYSHHAEQAAREDHIEWVPLFVPKEFEVIEATVRLGVVEKWVIRTHLNTETDLVLVVQPDGWVRTLWVNSKDDTHRTLNHYRYQQAA